MVLKSAAVDFGADSWVICSKTLLAYFNTDFDISIEVNAERLQQIRKLYKTEM